MTRNDALLVATLAVVALLAWPVVASAGGGDAIVITSPGGETTLSLAEDHDFVVEGRAGDVRVRVHDGEVAVIEAECPDGVCVATGAISAPGSVIACVPNGVVVRVEGGSDDEYDAHTR